MMKDPNAPLEAGHPVRFAKIEELRQWLHSRGIDTDRWGEGASKTVEDLWKEVSGAETLIFESPPFRHISFTQLLIRRGDKVLIEHEQSFADGRRRKRDALPAEKIKPGEDPQSAAVRCVYEELGVPAQQVAITSPDPVRSEVTEESPSYPGLTTLYTYYRVEMQVDGLPDSAFSTTGFEAQANDPVVEHFWVWRPFSSVISSID